MMDIESLQKPEEDEVPSHQKPEQNFVSMLVFYVKCSELSICIHNQRNN